MKIIYQRERKIQVSSNFVCTYWLCKLNQAFYIGLPFKMSTVWLGFNTCTMLTNNVDIHLNASVFANYQIVICSKAGLNSFCRICTKCKHDRSSVRSVEPEYWFGWCCMTSVSYQKAGSEQSRGSTAVLPIDILRKHPWSWAVPSQ